MDTSTHAFADIREATIYTFEFITIYGLCSTAPPMKGGIRHGRLKARR